MRAYDFRAVNYPVRLYSGRDAPARAANALARCFADLGMPARLSELEIPADGIEALVEDSMKNFNADPKREFQHHRAELLETLRACW